MEKSQCACWRPHVGNIRSGWGIRDRRGHRSFELTENLWFHSVRLVCSCIAALFTVCSSLSVCRGSSAAACITTKATCTGNQHPESCSLTACWMWFYHSVSFLSDSLFDLCRFDAWQLNYCIITIVCLLYTSLNDCILCAILHHCKTRLFFLYVLCVYFDLFFHVE